MIRGENERIRRVRAAQVQPQYCSPISYAVNSCEFTIARGDAVGARAIRALLLTNYRPARACGPSADGESTRWPSDGSGFVLRDSSKRHARSKWPDQRQERF